MVKLRKLQRKDAEFMLEWMHDPDIAKQFRFDAAAMDMRRAQAFIAACQETDDLHYAIVDETDEYLGTISLKSIDKENEIAEYAVVLRRKAMGKGIAKAATDNLLRIAFGEYGLNKIYLNVFEDNGRARAFYKKYGFCYEGCATRHLTVRGSKKDLCWYAYFKEDGTAQDGDL